MSLAVLLGSTLLLQLYVLRRLRFDWLTVAIVLAGTALYVRYLSYTSISERNYDGSSQLEYIRAIATERRLPDVYACGPCGHPPAYYALAALWGGVWAGATWLPRELALQWLSLLAFGGFVSVALLILREHGPVTPWVEAGKAPLGASRRAAAALRLGAVLVVFWPSSVIHSVRVHNDALASPLMLGAMYFMAQWDRRGTTRELMAALGLCVLALLTKSSAYPVAVSLIGLALWRCRPAERRARRLAQGATALAVIGVTAFATMALRESRVPTTLCQKVVGLACDGRYVPPVPDTPGRFLWFDVVAFLRGLAAPELPERDLFFNRFAKSSLFGVMPLGDELSASLQLWLAPVMGVLLLTMSAITWVGTAALQDRGWLRERRVYLILPAAMLVFLLAFRIRAPNEFHEDFRHIFPALVPMCLFYVRVVDGALQRSPWLRIPGYGLPIAMALASASFFAQPAPQPSPTLTPAPAVP